jgi:hypothetical protein
MEVSTLRWFNVSKLFLWSKYNQVQHSVYILVIFSLQLSQHQYLSEPMVNPCTKVFYFWSGHGYLPPRSIISRLGLAFEISTAAFRMPLGSSEGVRDR